MYFFRILMNRFMKHRKKAVAFFIGIIVVYIFKLSIILAIRDFLYLTRPVWDRDDAIEAGNSRIVHFYAPNIATEELCQLHGWRPRRGGSESFPRVIDAFIFSIELDMLEIRMKELWNVVDVFVLVEADTTFTGKAKPLFFNESKDRFNWAGDKLKHFIVKGLSSNPSKSFDNEASTRRQMTGFIKSLNPSHGDLIIVGDLDEIPYSHTIQLLKSCQGFPSGLHLQLQNYLYSFEFRLYTSNWKPHISIYDSSTFGYHHGKSKNANGTIVAVLADAGWHCSFCFPRISDFLFKMTSYSHSERVTSEELLKPETIQRKLCEGSDIYDMLPEAYSFQDLITQWGTPPKTSSTVGIPAYIVQNPNRFSYLMPGGCKRKESYMS